MTLSDFIHQKSYEKIAYRLHMHPIVTVPASALALVLLVLPPGIYLFSQRYFPAVFENELLFAVSTLFASIFYLGIGLFYYTYLVNYYLDLLVITNDRLLHIEQEGIFARTISEVDLYKIQDITSSIEGFLPSMLNYGDLLIQTAGALEKFYITNIPDPEHLRQKILDLAEEDRKFHLATKNIAPSI